MKELFKRLERYGTEWGLLFRIGENNRLVMELSCLDIEKGWLYKDQLMLMPSLFLDRDDFYPQLIVLLDHQYMRLTKDIKKY